MAKKQAFNKNSQRIIMTFLIGMALLILAAIAKTIIFVEPDEKFGDEISLEPATKQASPSKQAVKAQEHAKQAQKKNEPMAMPGVGSQAKDFTVKTFSGETFKLSDYRGKKPVLINLWASWCGPCKREAPLLEKAYQMYKDQGIEFIAVAVQDQIEDSKKFVKDFNLTYPNGFDETGRLHHEYKTFGVPETYIVDKNGIIVFRKPGAVYEHMLMPAIEAAIKQ